MAKIVLTKETGAFRIANRKGTLCMCHDAYDPPKTKATVVKFSEFRQSPREALAGVSRLFLVGMNRMITPGNRTEMVFEVLHNNTPDLNKTCIDNTLFVSEPWRAWFQFGAVSEPYGDYTYSYIAESHYSAWLENLRPDNPFSLEAIRERGKGVVKSLYPKFFDDIRVETRRVMPYIHEEYAELKRRAFEEEATAKAIIRRLALFAQNACPDRSVPALSDLHKSTKHRVVKTDLKVDDWLVGQLLDMAAMHDGIAGAFYTGE